MTHNHPRRRSAIPTLVLLVGLLVLLACQPTAPADLPADPLPDSGPLVTLPTGPVLSPPDRGPAVADAPAPFWPDDGQAPARALMGRAPGPTPTGPLPPASPRPVADTRPVRPAAGGDEGGRLCILMYHYIRDHVPAHDQLGRNLSVAPADFAQQMQLLVERGYTVLTLDDLLQARADGRPLPPRAVALTFDDGYSDFYTAAWPVLRRYHLRATVYVITGLLDRPGYLTWAQVQDLAASGITIGGHTLTHAHLPALTAPALERELAESRRLLESRLGRPVRHFAYPGGAYDARVRAAVGAHGYQTAVTTRMGCATPHDDPLALPRLRIWGGITLDQFAALLAHPPGGPQATRSTPSPTVTPHPGPGAPGPAGTRGRTGAGSAR